VTMDIRDCLKHLPKEILAVFLYSMRRRRPYSLNRDGDGHPLILYYHRVCNQEDDVLGLPDLIVSEDNFKKQVAFIKEYFNVLPLDVIVEQIKKGSRPSYCDIAITFDDGYIDTYRYAYPVLKHYGLPATVFLTTRYVNSSNLFWCDNRGDSN